MIFSSCVYPYCLLSSFWVLFFTNRYRNYFLSEAKQEVASLQKYAGSRGLKDNLKPWDIPYYRRLQCQAVYG